MDRIRHDDPQGWIDLLFSAEAATSGGVIRRKVAWVEGEIGVGRLIEEVRWRGFHMLRTGDQFVIVCNAGQIQIVV